MKPTTTTTTSTRSYQRESFDVTTIPGSERVLFVRFTLSPGACEQEGAINDASATYAVDTRGWRILAIQR